MSDEKDEIEFPIIGKRYWFQLKSCKLFGDVSSIDEETKKVTFDMIIGNQYTVKLSQIIEEYREYDCSLVVDVPVIKPTKTSSKRKSSTKKKSIDNIDDFFS